MRHSLGLVFFCALTAWSMATHATPASDFVENYNRLSRLERSRIVYEVCDHALKAWPKSEYTNSIRELGQLWLTQPEASYFALSTCQSMWVTQFMAPARLAKLKRRDQTRLIYLLGSADLLSSYLPEEIRLYMEMQPSDPHSPPSPFELLSPLASSERIMDERIHQEVRQAAKELVEAGGSVAMSLMTTKTFFDMSLAVSQSAAKAAKQALAVSIVALGLSEFSDYEIKQLRRSALEKRATELTQKLASPQHVPISILLDEFYKSQVQLGFFYSYSLYLRENNENADALNFNETCLDQVKRHFEYGAAAAPCADAASTWIRAAAYLRELFPNQPEALVIADKLAAKAKRAYWFTLELKEALRLTPLCSSRPSGALFPGDVECVDRESGTPAL